MVVWSLPRSGIVPLSVARVVSVTRSASLAPAPRTEQAGRGALGGRAHDGFVNLYLPRTGDLHVVRFKGIGTAVVVVALDQAGVGDRLGIGPSLVLCDVGATKPVKFVCADSGIIRMSVGMRFLGGGRHQRRLVVRPGLV